MKMFRYFIVFFTLAGYSQNISFRDSLDHKLDLSDWVIKAHGFIPVPFLITERALGNFGGGVMPIFIDQNTPYLDSINGKLVKTRVFPNIYGAIAGYTANDSWISGGFASGVIKKWRANYKVISGYANVNMNYYVDIPILGEEKFEFNIKTIPLSAQLIKKIGKSYWYSGIDYLFLKTTLSNSNPIFNTPKELNSLVSRVGAIVEYDTRDNIFSPDRGFKWNTLVAHSSNLIGSDYNYTSLNSTAYWHLPVSKQIYSGFRIEYQQVFGDIPFYIKPYIAMRGIPVVRYQGDIVMHAETEWRWDITPRYSLVAFGGSAKAYQKDENFSTADWRVSGGLGGRYLLARKLKLRMGLDLARGPETWTYSIVFGSSWLR